jgi:hypothetical protein
VAVMLNVVVRPFVGIPNKRTDEKSIGMIEIKTSRKVIQESIRVATSGVTSAAALLYVNFFVAIKSAIPLNIETKSTRVMFAPVMFEMQHEVSMLLKWSAVM